MKTKAEALANPAVGDRWRTKRMTRILIRDLKYGWASSTIATNYTNGYDCMTDVYFRRWAAGAEYLGNEGDNA